jgi:putative membrane protein
MKKDVLRGRLLPLGIAAILAGSVACSSGTKTETSSAPADAPTTAAKEPAKPVLSSDDKDFISMAAKDGYAEIRVAQMALTKSHNKDVKELAQKILDDHQKANADLAKIASNKGVTLPDSTTLTDKASEIKLKALSGTRFDQSFVSTMVSDHKDAVAAFQKEGMQGSDSDVKEFANDTVKHLQDHLTAAQELENKMKAGKGSKMS